MGAAMRDVWNMESKSRAAAEKLKIELQFIPRYNPLVPAMCASSLSMFLGSGVNKFSANA